MNRASCNARPVLPWSHHDVTAAAEAVTAGPRLIEQPPATRQVRLALETIGQSNVVRRSCRGFQQQPSAQITVSISRLQARHPAALTPRPPRLSILTSPLCSHTLRSSPATGSRRATNCGY